MIFLYAPKYRFSGSTVMRGDQLSSIISKAIGNNYTVDFKPLNSGYRNSILFMTKSAVFTVSIDELDSLSDKGNILLFDANDGILDESKIKFADVIVASSSIALDGYSNKYPNKEVVLIDHHVDPRIHQGRRIEGDKPKIGYFGEPTNTILTDKLSNLIDVFHVDTSSQDNISWIKHINKYNVHYAVRNKRDFDDFKPATKIFTAAYCRANVIIQESETEALRWLGEEYPYIIRGEVSGSSIENMVEKVINTYKKHEWYKGLESMDYIRNKLTNERIVGQFSHLLDILNR